MHFTAHRPSCCTVPLFPPLIHLVFKSGTQPESFAPGCASRSKRFSFGKSPESEAVTCSLTPESRSFSLSILWTTTPPRQTSNNPRPPPNTAASRSPKTTASNREEVKPKSVTVTTCSSEYISSRTEIPSGHCGPGIKILRSNVQITLFTRINRKDDFSIKLVQWKEPMHSFEN